MSAGDRAAIITVLLLTEKVQLYRSEGINIELLWIEVYLFVFIGERNATGHK